MRDHGANWEGAFDISRLASREEGRVGGVERKTVRSERKGARESNKMSITIKTG